MIQKFEMAAPAAALPWPVIWAPVFSAIGVVAVGCFAGYIAYRQWVTAHTKVQIDLYNLRLPVFLASASFVTCIRSGMGPEAAGANLFYKAKSEAAWLFHEELARYLDGVYRDGIDLHIARAGTFDEEHQEPIPPDSDEEKRLSARMDTHHTYLPVLFGPFLKLEARSSKAVRNLFEAKVGKELLVRSLDGLGPAVSNAVERRRTG